MRSKVANKNNVRDEPHFWDTIAAPFLTIMAAAGLALSCSTAFAQAPIPTVVSAVAMGPITQNPLIVGRDGTWSAVINNRSEWAFSDTKIGNAQSDHLISNSRSWTTNLNASNGIDLTGDYTDANGNITEDFPFTSDETTFNDANNGKSGCTINTDPTCGQQYAIWSAPIVNAPSSSGYEGYFFYKLLMRGGSLPNRVIVGVGIAYMKNGVLHRPTLSPGTAHPTLMWQLGPQGQSFTAYYAGGILLGNTLYMTSCDTIVNANHECFLAKVPIANILTLDDWSYWNGATWVNTPDFSQSALLYDGSPNGSTMIYIAGLNEYMTMYSPGNNNNDMVFRVASQPWGPWSGEQALFTGQPSISDPSEYDYDTLPHPEFQGTNGLVQYVTYVQHDLDLGQGGEQVQLVKVTFAK